MTVIITDCLAGVEVCTRNDADGLVDFTLEFREVPEDDCAAHWVELQCDATGIDRLLRALEAGRDALAAEGFVPDLASA